MQATVQQKRRDYILKGNLFKVMLTFTLPLIIYQFFNYLYGFVDMLLVADLGASFVNSVVFIDEIKSATTAFGVSIAAAGSVIIARHYGANEITPARKNAANALMLGVTISLTVTMIMVILGIPILTLFGANADNRIIEEGLSYYNIQMFTICLITINSVFMGIERAKGNTKFILWLNLAAMLVKLVLSIIWIKLLNGDLVHLALASLIAQLLITVIAVITMSRKNNVLKIGLSDLRIDRRMMTDIIILAIPVFLGKYLFSMGKVIINGIALLYHPFAVGALGIASKIHSVISSLANVFEESEMSVISQNLGNKNTKRAIKTFFIALGYALVISVIGMIAATFWLDWMISVLLVGTHYTAENIDVIKSIYAWEQFSSISSAMIAVSTGLFIAFRRTKIVFLINFLRVFVLRLPVLWLLYYLVDQNAYWHVGFVMFISNTTTMIIALTLAGIHIRNVRIFGEVRLQLT